MTSNIPIFDGHNDVLLRLYRSASSDVVSDFLVGEERGHIDLKKARAGSFVGGFFAMYSPSPGNFSSLSKQMTGGQYAVPLPVFLLKFFFRTLSIAARQLPRRCKPVAIRPIGAAAHNNSTPPYRRTTEPISRRITSFPRMLYPCSSPANPARMTLPRRS